MAVGRLGVLSASVGASRGFLSLLKATVPGTAGRGRLGQLSVSIAQSGPRGFLGRMFVGVSPEYTVNAGADLLYKEPYTTQTITATADAAVDLWTFEVLLSPEPITLVGSGNVRTFVVPAVFNGTSFQVKVTASGGAKADGSDTLSVVCLPHCEFWASPAGVWEPVRYQEDW